MVLEGSRRKKAGDNASTLNPSLYHQCDESHINTLRMLLTESFRVKPDSCVCAFLSLRENFYFFYVKHYHLKGRSNAHLARNSCTELNHKRTPVMALTSTHTQVSISSALGFFITAHSTIITARVL